MATSSARRLMREALSRPTLSGIFLILRSTGQPRRENIKLDAEGITKLRDEVYFITNDGKKQRFGGSGSYPSGSHAKIELHPDIGAFDPATTSLFIREPAAIEIVPFELTFKDIPIIDR